MISKTVLFDYGEFCYEIISHLSFSAQEVGS